MSSSFAVIVGGDAVIVVGCLLLGGIFLLIGLAFFLEAGDLVGLFKFFDYPFYSFGLLGPIRIRCIYEFVN